MVLRSLLTFILLTVGKNMSAELFWIVQLEPIVYAQKSAVLLTSADKQLATIASHCQVCQDGNPFHIANMLLPKDIQTSEAYLDMFRQNPVFCNRLLGGFYRKATGYIYMK